MLTTPKMLTTIKSQIVFAVCLAGWLAAVLVGLRMITKYEVTSGEGAKPPAIYPAQSRILPDAQLPTLIMTIHPRCPCSRASMNELQHLMTKYEGRVATYVVFVKPPDFPAEWAKSDLWAQAQAIKGVQVMVDEGGAEARRFASHTSGQTMLYSADGRLLFSGGITAARGHEGASEGQSRIAALLTQSPTQQMSEKYHPEKHHTELHHAETHNTAARHSAATVDASGDAPVFGCPLFEKTAAAADSTTIKDACDATEHVGK